MNYEQTPIKKANGHQVKKASREHLLKQIDTSAIIWHLIKRHKFGLMTFWAVTMTVFYLLPFVPDMILSALMAL